MICTHFCHRLRRTQGLSAAGTFKLMETPIRKLTRYLPTCSAVTEPTAPTQKIIMIICLSNDYIYHDYTIICFLFKFYCHYSITVKLRHLNCFLNHPTLKTSAVIRRDEMNLGAAQGLKFG